MKKLLASVLILCASAFSQSILIYPRSDMSLDVDKALVFVWENTNQASDQVTIWALSPTFNLKISDTIQWRNGTCSTLVAIPSFAPESVTIAVVFRDGYNIPWLTNAKINHGAAIEVHPNVRMQSRQEPTFFYSIQGKRISGPIRGIYIQRTGKVSKVKVKL